MSQKQKAKHIADKTAAKAVLETYPVNSSLHGADPTSDGLGTWEGGRETLRNVNNWVTLKSRATSLGDAKHLPTGVPVPETTKIVVSESEAPEPYRRGLQSCHTR